MNRAYVFIIAMLFLIGSSQTTRAQYYYGDNRVIPLSIDSSKVLIRIDSSVPVFQTGSIVDEIPRISAEISDSNLIDGFQVFSLSSTSGYDAFLDTLNGMYGIDIAEPYYITT